MYRTLAASLVLRNLLRIRKSIAQVSDKSWEVAPGGSAVVPPAVHLADDLEKVTGFGDYSDQATEWARVKGGEVTHHPTVAHLLKKVDIFGGHLWKGSLKDRVVGDQRSTPDEGPVHSLREGVLSSTLFGSVYFGHWLTDDLSAHVAGEALGTPLRVAHRPYHHEPQYQELLKIGGPMVHRARVDELTVLTDFGQNSHKRARYQELRRRLAEGLEPGSHRLVMIRRGEKQQGASRSLVNRDQLEDHLVSQGFRIVDPDVLSPRQIAQALHGAEIVVSVEGSHLAHAVYAMAEHGAYCVLQPPYRFNNVFKGYADCLGQSYGFLVGDAVEGGFRVAPDHLDRLLEKLRRP